MHRAILSILLAIGIPAACAAIPALTRQKLAEDRIIQNYPCAQGWAWFYPDGSLRQCALARPTTFGAAQVPAGSIIVLTPDGKPHHVFLSRDWTIAGYQGMGPGWLPVAEGSITAFYPSGRLQSIYLVADQTIQGVPCRGGQWGIFTDPFGGGNHVEFYENGNLRACKLTHDYKGRKSGHRIELPQ